MAQIWAQNMPSITRALTSTVLSCLVLGLTCQFSCISVICLRGFTECRPAFTSHVELNKHQTHPNTLTSKSFRSTSCRASRDKAGKLRASLPCKHQTQGTLAVFPIIFLIPGLLSVLHCLLNPPHTNFTFPSFSSFLRFVLPSAFAMSIRVAEQRPPAWRHRG